MSSARKIISVLLMASMLALIVLLPKYASGLLGAQSALDWLTPKKEAFSGVISCWHVVRFKPYSGSMGAWLEKYARRMEKRHFGVYFEVESMTESEAERRMAAGLFPDIISFPRGFIEKSELRETASGTASDAENESLRAWALAASCELLLYYPETADGEETELLETAKKHNLEEFKSGKSPCCVADVRGAGDMQRLLSAGKADYFEVLPFASETELVQFIGIVSKTEDEKLPYALEYIDLILGEAAQTELVSIGLLAMNKAVSLSYEQSFLADAYRRIAEGGGVSGSAFD
ncbi:MAG: hypothetical protein IKZ82_08220 [Clostridia bacterium]|nr:hypothetical protein [Clostridia bacterium]